MRIVSNPIYVENVACEPGNNGRGGPRRVVLLLLRLLLLQLLLAAGRVVRSRVGRPRGLRLERPGAEGDEPCAGCIRRRLGSPV